jgi:hypothetical protein
MVFFVDLFTSSLRRGIQMGEISKLGWLIGFTEHAMWADSRNPVLMNFS